MVPENVELQGLHAEHAGHLEGGPNSEQDEVMGTLSDD